MCLVFSSDEKVPDIWPLVASEGELPVKKYSLGARRCVAFYIKPQSNPLIFE